MNKSLLTNILAIAMMGAGYHIQNDYLWYAGLFAFSGAITNWLAIHMLFEKVPGLYGSGVIPARFEEFKLAIKNLMMELNNRLLHLFHERLAHGLQCFCTAKHCKHATKLRAFDDFDQ